MNAHDAQSIPKLRASILRSVSRSFYLSIRFLPAKLRDPIALAYLLARATDTIADTAEVSAAVRTDELMRLAALIQNDDDAASGSFAAFAAQQNDAAERRLIESLPTCLAWLRAMPGADRADIRNVLARINEGQMLDVQRFADPARVVALPGAADLERYTYLVAGCVGEFWTNVCLRYLQNFSRRSPEEMRSLGRDFGQGLQLVNILRDAGKDLRAGRSYFPAEEIHSLGAEAETLLGEAQRLNPLLQKWGTCAEQGMKAGLDYACAIRSWRVRFATALPALLGIRTLTLLRAAGSRALNQNIKMPRREVRQIIFRSIRTLAAPATLRALFAELAADSPNESC